MFDKERILYQLERTRAFSLQMIARVPHDKWFEMPLGITHVAWNVGHMAIAEYFLGLVLVRGFQDEDAAIIPEQFSGLFGYGSTVSEDASAYPTPDEILAVMARVHNQLLEETRALPLAAFDEPCQFLEGEFDHHPVFELKGAALEWLTYHEHVHVGTIGLLRRQLGAAPIEYFQESRAGKKFA